MPLVQRFSDGVWVWQDDPPRCQEVPADIVSADVTSLAELALDVVVEDLGLAQRPTIKWFAPESANSKRLRTRYGRVPWMTFAAGDDVKGIVLGRDLGSIWLRYDTDELDVPEIVYHEAKHHDQDAQFVAGVAPLLEGQAAEDDAERYAATLMATIEAEGDAYRAEVAATKARPPFAPVRKSRGTGGHREFQCDCCSAWVRVGVTHACPVARSWRR